MLKHVKREDSVKFWQSVYPEGATEEQLQNELHDFYSLMKSVQKIYPAVSQGRLSANITYTPETVISAVQAAQEDAIDEANEELKEEVKDLKEEIEELKAALAQSWQPLNAVNIYAKDLANVENVCVMVAKIQAKSRLTNSYVRLVFNEDSYRGSGDFFTVRSHCYAGTAAIMADQIVITSKRGELVIKKDRFKAITGEG